jgi:hypothetical protein
MDTNNLETKIVQITPNYCITEKALTQFQNLFLHPLDREKALHSLPHHLSDPTVVSSEIVASSYLRLHYQRYMNNTYIIDQVSFTEPKQKTFDRLKRLRSVSDQDDEYMTSQSPDYSFPF